MMTDCRYTLCLESLESPAGPGPEHGECPATRHQLRAPGRHLHRPVGQVAPEPEQEASAKPNQFPSKELQDLQSN